MGHHGSTRGRYVAYSKHGLSDSKNGQLMIVTCDSQLVIGIYQYFSTKKRALDGNLERIFEKVVRVKLYCFLIMTC